MTIKNYAKKYKVSPTTVHRWIAQNSLKAERVKVFVERWDVEDKKIEKKPRYKLPPRYKNAPVHP